GSSSVPHKTLLPEGIRPGTVLKIQGIVPEKANSFYVNLLCSEGEDADAALHFNPRLDTAEVVFNSKQRGSWGTEERGSGVPFRRGVPFEVLLIATDEGFKAVVGNSLYYVFDYRILPVHVRLMEVGGDVELDLVKIL
ncbi:galectin-7, partial [Tupaia chinensis]|uniref:galectin-7 n=1 Tax=Tupaia chinensis TaxID=246437 RepID=UPI0003C8F138